MHSDVLHELKPSLWSLIFKFSLEELLFLKTAKNLTVLGPPCPDVTVQWIRSTIDMPIKRMPFKF